MRSRLVRVEDFAVSARAVFTGQILDVNDGALAIRSGSGHKKDHVFTAGFHLVAVDFNLDVDVGRAVVTDTVRESGVLKGSGSDASETRCTEAAGHNWGRAIDLDGDSKGGNVLVGLFAAALGSSGNDNAGLTGS
jgi:hypothetical protein